ncbi:hypothetical protein EYZ11_010373 [Aspergillus tanneri]|uniref:Uncharacterized protein n=1 Tax=Aspergillus tanneri TaxID=1220188 RepID=A0A4S3J5G9_9EURO|nr:hypothetical protein EYZ11_010373 [Aspergillus tanneri]
MTGSFAQNVLLVVLHEAIEDHFQNGPHPNDHLLIQDKKHLVCGGSSALIWHMVNRDKATYGFMRAVAIESIYLRAIFILRIYVLP